jgi:S1-C subfamily serine protease
MHVQDEASSIPEPAPSQPAAPDAVSEAVEATHADTLHGPPDLAPTEELRAFDLDDIPSPYTPIAPELLEPAHGHEPRVVRLKSAAAAVVAVALLSAGVSYGTVKLTEKSTSSTPAAANTTVPAKAAPSTTGGGSTTANTLVGTPLDIHTIVTDVGPAVVSIEIGQQSGNGTVVPVAAGSGVVISTDGLVLTNSHVVNVTDSFGRTLTNETITVKLADGTTEAATLLGSAPDDDIALIRVTKPTKLVAATLGNSDSLKVGDDVVAIGNALDLGSSPTVTKGIVSATNRTLQVDASVTLRGLIQTDAAINHGNSGGALVNSAGQVVGINSAGIPNAQNLGFAIASNTITPLLDKLKSGGTVAAQPKPFLGVSTSDTSDGVLIGGITSGSGAEKAGLQVDDVIIAVDGASVTTGQQLGDVILSHKPGDQLRVTVIRSGSQRTVIATLGSRQG